MDVLTPTDQLQGFVKQYLQYGIIDETCEFEVIYGSHPMNNPLQKETFLKLLQYLRSNYEQISESNTLDVLTQYIKYNKKGLSNIRCSIEGTDSIKKLCKTNEIQDLSNVTFIKKTPYSDKIFMTTKFPSIKNEEYNVRVNIKRETTLDPSNFYVRNVIEEWNDSLKYFRYKKRFSFVTPDKLFRIDVTAVKSNDYNRELRQYNLYKDIKSSKILHNKETYELEIEYIGTTNGSIDTIVDHLDIQLQPKVTTTKGNIHSEVTFNEDLGVYLDKDNYPVDIDSEYTNEDVTNYIYSDNPFSGRDKYIGQEVVIDESFWKDSDQEDLQSKLLEGGKTLLYKGWLFKDSDVFGTKDIELFDKLGISETTPYIVTDIIEPFTEEELEGRINQIIVPQTYVTNISVNPFTESSITASDNDNPFSGQKGGGKKEPPSWIPKKHIIKQMTERQDKRSDAKVIQNILDSLNHHTYDLLTIIYDTRLLVSKQIQESVIDQYNQTVEQDKYRFIGPQPVSFSMNELVPENPHSVLQGYVVTEKADGDRAQLIIMKDHHGYLLTPKKKVIDTGLHFTNIEGIWIFDGEWITQNKNNQPIRLFMIFDVYWAADAASEGLSYPSPAYTYPWISKKKKDISRYSIIHDFKTTVIFESQVIDSIRIGFKQYLEGPKKLLKKKGSDIYSNLTGMGKMSKKILLIDKKGGYEYKIDGLIYLPMYLSVSAMNVGDNVTNIGMTWSINYKWKPPEENTIDFRVRTVKDGTRDKITSSVIDKKVQQCKEVMLSVSYDYRKDKEFDYCWKVLSEDYSTPKREILFNPENKKRSDIHLTNIITKNGKMICEKDHREIVDGMIIEMRYTFNDKNGLRWKPLRVRDDKIRPQASWVAKNIWKTITNPVTYEMITGQTDITKIQGDIQKQSKDEHYYVMDYAEDTDIMNPLRGAHNYIKNRLITDILSLDWKRPLSIMDTSIGRGGDIQKYLSSKNKIKFLFGLDISSDIQEAGRRYYTSKQNKPPALLIQYDTSKNIKDGSGFIGSEDKIDKNKTLLDILYQKNKKVPKEYKLVRDKLSGIANDKFDIISSQFSVHYYFKDKDTLDGYLRNLQENCRPRGYFIGTCYDGMKVYQTLQDNPIIEHKDEFGNMIYKLEKQYELDDFTYDAENIDKMYGQEINVYMSSIGQEITEYLVNFEFFKAIMEEYGFTLVKPPLRGKNSGLFNNDKHTIIDGFGSFAPILDSLEDMSKRDPRIKKFYSESVDIVKPENKFLYEISSFNNWFIFQKS